MIVLSLVVVFSVLTLSVSLRMYGSYRFRSEINTYRLGSSFATIITKSDTNVTPSTGSDGSGLSIISSKILDVLKHISERNQALLVQDVKITESAVDIVVAKHDSEVSPTIDELNEFHAEVYSAMEKDSILSSQLERFDITIGSEGIGKELSTDKDFISFKGYDIIVHTNEVFKKRTEHSGTLVRRTDEFIVLSKKGRLLTVPRPLVVKVCFQNSEALPE